MKKKPKYSKNNKEVLYIKNPKYSKNKKRKYFKMKKRSRRGRGCANEIYQKKERCKRWKKSNNLAI